MKGLKIIIWTHLLKLKKRTAITISSLITSMIRNPNKTKTRIG